MPPYRREIDASTWLNDWNSRSIAVGRDADPGVADVDRDLPATRRPAAPARRPAAAERAARPRPTSVNLTAFDSRLRTIWRSRPGVADDARRQVVVERVERARRPSPRPAGEQVERALDDAAQRRTAGVSSSTLPASILEKSRMSLMTVSSASPEVLIVSA